MNCGRENASPAALPCCQTRLGHQRIWLNVAAGRRSDFADVERALVRSGAFATLDPPWPAVANA